MGNLRITFGVAAALFFVLPCMPAASTLLAAEPKSSWQADWEKTVKAAEDEGNVAIYMTQAFEPVFREAFQKKFPKIKVSIVTGRGFQLGQRIMAERRGEKYIVDLCITGNVTPLTVFHKAKILEPIRPLLVLPDVVDPSGWFEGKHHYNDPENRYIFIFEGTPRSGDITYNTKLVNPSEIRSYWNLLDAKWKSKIVTVDPLVAGPINTPQIFFYKHPDLGPEFLKRLYAETNMTIVRADEQLMDWLSLGKYAMGFGGRDVDKAMQQGLHGDVVPERTDGKVIASFLMLGGLALVSVITATITSAFVARRQTELQETGEDPVIQRLDRIAARLDSMEAELSRLGGAARPPSAGRDHD